MNVQGLGRLEEAAADFDAAVSLSPGSAAFFRYEGGGSVEKECGDGWLWGRKGDSILAAFLTCRSLTSPFPPHPPPSSHFSPPFVSPSEIAPSVGELRTTSPAVSQTSRVRSSSSRRTLHPTYSAATGVWKCGYRVCLCVGGCESS